MKKNNLSEICDIICELNKKEKIQTFLTEILTETELEDISKRWEILKFLSQNESQRNISKKLNVSLCKITRGSKILKNNKSITKKILYNKHSNILAP